MRKREFVDRVAAKSGLSKRDASKAVDAFLETVADALRSGETVSFSGFGKFGPGRAPRMTRGRQPWHDRAYRRFSSVGYVGSSVIVAFENGDVVSVAPNDVLPSGVEGVDWASLSHDGSEFSVTTSDGPAEVLWSQVRALTDERFRQEVEAADAEHAGHVGRRLRALRQRRGMTASALAQRAGMTPQSLSRLEHGRHDVVFTTLERLLDAMGASLRDLAVEEESAEAPGIADEPPSESPTFTPGSKLREALASRR